MNKAKLKEIGSLLRYLGDLFESLVEEKSFNIEAIGTVVSDNVEAKAEVGPTLEQVREVLGKKSSEGFAAMVRALLASYGARKLSDVDPKYYAKLMSQAEALKNG